MSNLFPWHVAGGPKNAFIMEAVVLVLNCVWLTAYLSAGFALFKIFFLEGIGGFKL